MALLPDPGLLPGPDVLPSGVVLLEVGVTELEVSRRAWPEAQAAFAGPPVRRIPALVDVGWHGSEVSAEDGATAVVRRGGPYDGDAAEVIGEVLCVTYRRRPAFVYVVGAADVAEDISLSRRAWVAIAGPFRESVPAVVEVIR